MAGASGGIRRGHVSPPNGLGVDYPDRDGAGVITGTAPNELTASDDRDWFAGTHGTSTCRRAWRRCRAKGFACREAPRATRGRTRPR
jgi:hypothetical protein